MKSLERNKRKFFYALYTDKLPRIDEYGNETGEYEIVRENPIEAYANISAAKGEVSTQMFGSSEGYDKVIVMDNNIPDIDEYTVLWVDSEPELDATGALVKSENGDTVTPYDYTVKKVAKSLNSVSIAISKVTVNGE